MWSSARNAVASGSATPTFVTNAIGGKQALRFDGADDHLTLPTGFHDFTAGMSLYVVMRPTVLPNGFKVLALGDDDVRSMSCSVARARVRAERLRAAGDRPRGELHRP